MINYNKSIPKFTTIKELLYHSATVFSSNVAFTEKVKKDNNINYMLLLCIFVFCLRNANFYIVKTQTFKSFEWRRRYVKGK